MVRLFFFMGVIMTDMSIKFDFATFLLLFSMVLPNQNSYATQIDGEQVSKRGYKKTLKKYSCVFKIYLVVFQKHFKMA